MKTWRKTIAGLVIMATSFAFAPVASADQGCPEIKRSPSPTDPSHVRELFWDLRGCQIPLREGIGHIPHRRGDFGYQHIVSRYQEGEINHETTPFAKKLWQQALFQAGQLRDKDYLCHYKQFTTSSGRKRTMRVLVDYKLYEGHIYKGITSAFWVSGHVAC
jgi:hypothetical protein